MTESQPPELTSWRMVDEGWGRKAGDFATMAEPGNSREYVAVQRHLDVGVGKRLLDVACGAGLAIELAQAQGAICSGIDASPRLVAVACDRKASPGAWVMAPFALASPEKLRHQASMVSLGRPGAGETLLAEHRFTEIRRVDVPFAWEFADPEAYARAMASSGPAYEVIQDIGEEAFLEAPTTLAAQHVRPGLPIRAELKCVAYIARKPAAVAMVAPSTDR